MNKILVTGYNGFLGKHLCSEILKRFPNCEIIYLDCNLANPLELAEWGINNSEIISDVQYFFHLAAYSDYGIFNEQLEILEEPNYEDIFFLNQYINTNVLSIWSMKCPQAKMIAFGTGASYINSEPIENNYMKDECDNDYMPHVMTKRMLLTGLKILEKSQNLKWIYYVPSTLFGPNFKKDDMHLVPYIIKSLMINKKLKCSGIEKNIIFVKDAIKMILKTINLENQIINLFSNDNITLGDLAKKIKNILNVDTEIEFESGLKSKSFKKNSSIFDNEFEFTKLDDSLNKTLNEEEEIL